MIQLESYQSGRALGMRKALAAGIAAAFAFTLAAAADAATIVVNSLADSGISGICVLRDAITAANTKKVTKGCAAGTGNDTIIFSVTGTIRLTSTLPQITASRLTINGPGSPGIRITGGGAMPVIAVFSGATNLNRLTIADGNSLDGGGIFNQGKLSVTNSRFAHNSGSAIYNANSTSTLIVSHCVFFGNNFTGGSGGAIENDSGGRVIVTGTAFIRNSTSSGSGGAIDNLRGTVMVHNSVFFGNSTSSGSGGAIESINASGPVIVTGSAFIRNKASSGSGGAIDNLDAALTVRNSVFFDNHTSGGVGGAIDHEIGTVTVTRSTFAGNSADVGGGLENDLSTGTVSSSTFVHNSANNAEFTGGGAIENFGELTVINSTFSKNRGGGIVNGALLSVTDSTFSKNYNGGIVNQSGVVSLKTTLLAANPGGDCVEGLVTDAGFNIADDSTCGFSATGSSNSTDPKLDPRGLRKNGGPTKTIALESGSPAIDVVPIADCTDQASPPSRVTTDQRGFLRPDHNESVCDIGGFESQQPDGGR